MIAFQLGREIYYSTARLIKPTEALRVWYATGYARKLHKTEDPITLFPEPSEYFLLWALSAHFTYKDLRELGEVT